MKKLPRQATEENKAKKKARRCQEPIIYSICGLRHVQIIKSLLQDNFSFRNQQMVPNYFLYPYKYPEFHLRKIWSQFLASYYEQIMAACILIDKLKLSRWPVIGKVRRELGFYCYLYSLTHSLTHSNR